MMETEYIVQKANLQNQELLQRGGARTILCHAGGNETMNAAFASLGVATAQLLLPQKDVDLSRWAVVACDQFTSQPEYWEKADALVGDAPSTLRLIYPEAYLEDGQDRVPAIHKTMRAYLDRGVFAPAFEGMVLVERATRHGVRLGLVLAVDLEAYDHTPGNDRPIRATEGTILSRIPPRMRIREDAPLELPHILLLADDPTRSIVEPLYEARQNLRALYDTPLMLGGGHVRGWAVEGEALTAVARAMKALPCPGGLRFAVGDGNHSLATARACWMKLRERLGPEARATHPARYALAELGNVHDAGILFEPIHRALFGVTAEKARRAFAAWLAEKGAAFSDQPTPRSQSLALVGETESVLHIQNAPQVLPVATLQAFLDEWLPSVSATVDYIHGDDVLRALAAKPNQCGFLLPAMDKHALFPAIAQDGVLPRKTFSMGEADEKRYYLECR
ncbi:MAG: DUF1015 domain-containing protein, partial [Bacteroidales bacterium]|nr:DUF1015 domain-containing protein [Bacteroidales bacterium]